MFAFLEWLFGGETSAAAVYGENLKPI